MKKSQLRQLIKEELLKENSPGFDTRSSGAPLPTLDTVKAAYEAKKDKEPRDGVKRAAAKLGMKPWVKENNTYNNQVRAIEKIFDIIRESGIEVEDVLEEIGTEFGFTSLHYSR